MQAVNVFLPRMQKELQKSFLDDLADYLENSNCKENAQEDALYKAPYEIIFIVAMKL